MSHQGELRAGLVREQLQALLGHVRRAGESLAPRDHFHVAQAAAVLVSLSRLEEGLPQEISVVRSATSIDDALQLLVEEREEAEEA